MGRGSVIAVGAEAPEFTGTTSEGAPFALSSTRGRPLVLYFYPKANTPGCTQEARGFTEHYEEFRRAGVAVVGVSVDDVGTQRDFVERCGIPFPIVADRDRSISRRYGVLGLLGFSRRVTFFIDPDGRVAHVVEGMMPGPHLRAALERLGHSPSP